MFIYLFFFFIKQRIQGNSLAWISSSLTEWISIKNSILSNRSKYERSQWTCTDLNMNPISRRCGPCISIKGMHQWNCPLLTHVGVTMKLVVVGFANGLEYAKGVLSKKKEDALEAKKGVECLWRMMRTRCKKDDLHHTKQKEKAPPTYFCTLWSEKERKSPPFLSRPL